MTDVVQYAVENHVATVTLNRPEKYNALTTEMVRALHRILNEIQEDDDVRAILLNAAGKGFCAGQDLTEMQSLEAEGAHLGDHLRAGLNIVITQMRTLEKPVICAIHGVAAGAGASLTLAADLRVAARDAAFAFGAFGAIGLVPDSGATYFLPQIIGTARAFELMTLSDARNRLSADKAHQWGLVNVVTLPDRLQQDAASLARRFATMPTVSVGLTKRALYTNTGRSLPEALEAEAQYQDLAAQTADHQEGLAAFHQKRNADFEGN